MDEHDAGCERGWRETKNHKARVFVALRRGGGAGREINVRGWHGLTNPFWEADGRGLTVSAGAALGATLLYVDLEGRGQVVWQQRFPIIDYPAGGIPSPDDGHLAVFAVSADRNVWLLENF